MTLAAELLAAFVGGLLSLPLVLGLVLRSRRVKQLVMRQAARQVFGSMAKRP